MGLTQGLFSAMVAEHAPADLRGSAFGVFNLASGVAMLLASGIAGALWDAAGARAAFALGATIALLTVIALAAARRTLARREAR
jgi:MFS family permease